MNLFYCHCIPDRSIQINNKPVICYRCFGILVGYQVFLLAYILTKYLSPLNKIYPLFFDLSPVYLFLSGLFIIPLVLDGYTQKWGFRLSNNYLRFISGFLFGVGVDYILLQGVFVLKNFLF